MAMTWGEIKAAMAAVADTDEVHIGITIAGGTSPVDLPGFVVTGTILHKPVEKVEKGVVS